MRRNKYNARKVTEDNITFDSIAEYSRYCDLKSLQQAGEITGLEVHKRFIVFDAVLDGKREKVVYEADFIYQENGRTIAEDVKGVKTEVFKIKAKLFRARYPEIDFRTVDQYGRAV